MLSEFTYSSNGIEISVKPSFMHHDHRSGCYIWEYKVQLVNRCSYSVKLLARHWEIYE